MTMTTTKLTCMTRGCQLPHACGGGHGLCPYPDPAVLFGTGPGLRAEPPAHPNKSEVRDADMAADEQDGREHFQEDH